MSLKLNPDAVHSWLKKQLKEPLRSTIIAGCNDDDCAAIKVKKGILIISTDFLHSNPIATQLGIGDEWDLGRLTVAANLSDLCGSGAKPRALLIGTMFPKPLLSG